MDHRQLIPERDSGPTPKPRNRPSLLSSTTGKNQKSSPKLKGHENDVDDVISLSSISSASSGIDNLAFSQDELPREKTHTKTTTPPSSLHKNPSSSPSTEQKTRKFGKQTSSNNNNNNSNSGYNDNKKNKKYISSDSDIDNNASVSVSRHQVFAADIHSLPPEKEDESQGFWTIENEVEESRRSSTKLNLNAKPKPKPRVKISNSDDQSMSSSSDGTSAIKSKNSFKNNNYSSNKRVEESSQLPSETSKSKIDKVKDYLAVTISPVPDKKKIQEKGVTSDDSEEEDNNKNRFKKNHNNMMEPEKPIDDFKKNNNNKWQHHRPPHSIINLSTSDHDDDNDDDSINKLKTSAFSSPKRSTNQNNKNKHTKPDTRIDIENLESQQSSSSSRSRSSSRDNFPNSNPERTEKEGSSNIIEMQSFSQEKKSQFFTNPRKKRDNYEQLQDKSDDDDDDDADAKKERETTLEQNSNANVPTSTSVTAERNGSKRKSSRQLIMRDEESEIERLKSYSSNSRKKMTNNPDSPDLDDKSKSKRDQRRAEKEQVFDKYFGVTIHCCDLLPMDPNIIHPVVKVTILQENGVPFTKHKVLLTGKTSHRHHHYQGSSSPTTMGRRGQKGKDLPRRNSKGDDDDDGSNDSTGGGGGSSNKKGSFARSKNRTQKSSSSFQNHHHQTHANVPRLHSDSVLPIMTQPCKLSYYLPTFAPNWNELLLFEEPFRDFIHPEAETILFFEVMDFLPVRGPHSSRSTSRLFSSYHGSEAGWYKIAWGFLKLVGVNGVRNINRKIRLQLFKPESLPSKYREGIEVYHWWRSSTRTKINSTLYVTVKGVKPPAKTATSLRTLLTMRKDHLAQAIIESQLKTPQSPRKRRRSDEMMLKRKPGKTDLTIDIPQWTRLEGQSCKVPNTILKSLPVSQIESLNLTISGNVQCVKFTPCGLKLAAGLDTEELHTILIFEIPSGKLLCSIRCHHGLIYDLDWLTFGDRKDVLPDKYHLASASADTTATVWEIRPSKESPKLIKKLLHTSFVYSVRLHPTRENIVVTGCFDYIIRIWDIDRDPSSKPNLRSETESVPIIQLDRHESFVNCFVFDKSGLHLFSGDGSGCVFDWTARSPFKKKSWKVEREITFRESGKNPINSLSLHPSGNRLLVHIRNSCIKILDLETFLVLHSFSGLVNEKLQIQSCFSPCGNLVLSGSEDSTLCIWDADTGSIIQFITPENHKNCAVTCVDYHPYDHYAVIGLSSAISEPSPIILYSYKSQAKANRSPKIRFPTMAKVATALRSSYEQHHHHDHSHSLTHHDSKGPPSLNNNNNNKEDEFSLSATTSQASQVHRGDSTEKFMMIVKKLDSALKVTRRSENSKNIVLENPASAPALVEKEKSDKNRNRSGRLTPEAKKSSVATRGYDDDNDHDDVVDEDEENEDDEDEHQAHFHHAQITTSTTTTEIEKGGWRKSRNGGNAAHSPKLNTKSEIITSMESEEIYFKSGDDKDRKIVQVNMKHHQVHERKAISSNGLQPQTHQQHHPPPITMMTGPSKNLAGDSFITDDVNNNNENTEETDFIKRKDMLEEPPEKDFSQDAQVNRYTGKNSKVRQKRRERMRQIYNTSDFID